MRPALIEHLRLPAKLLRSASLVARAALFALRAHRGSRRLNGQPYVLHPLQIALVLWMIRVRDAETLASALLHDVLEQGVPASSLARCFGPRVVHCVRELTDDMNASRAERKRLQVLTARQLSRSAKLIRLSDKAMNLRDMPDSWAAEDRLRYLNDAWAIRDAVRDTQPELEALFDRIHSQRTADLNGSGESFLRILKAARCIARRSRGSPA